MPTHRPAGTSLAHHVCLALALGAGLLLGACSAPSVLLNVVGATTDSGVTWAVVKHMHAKLTDGDDVPCVRLDSVERALSGRCGDYVAGTLRPADAVKTEAPMCPLARAARDPRLWPMLPELIEKGAQPEACARSPLVELAQAQNCPDFRAASSASREALLWLAQADARAVHHDVVRMLSCPIARDTGFDAVLSAWLAQGALQPGALAFGPLSALHPDYLGSAFSVQLEAAGHTARTAQGPYAGKLTAGFEEALRTHHWAALNWWLTRAPELVNRVPAAEGSQLPWNPLARVMVPKFLADPDRQGEMVAFLLARGADPMRRLPHQPDLTVMRYARSIDSPMLPLLEASLRARGTPSANVKLAKQGTDVLIGEAAAVGAVASPVAPRTRPAAAP